MFYAAQVSAYFPPGRWYSIWDDSVVEGGNRYELDAPLGEVPVHVLGGTVVPLQVAALTTRDVRLSPLTLLVALAGVQEARFAPQERRG